MFLAILYVAQIMPTRRRQLLLWLGVAAVGNLAGCNSGNSTTQTTPTSAKTTQIPDNQQSAVTPTATLTPTSAPTKTRTTTQESTAPTQSRKFDPKGVDEDDLFGERVMLSRDGTTALVGAKRDENSRGKESGSVYVFSGTGGSWKQEKKLLPKGGDINDRFGSSIAISEDGTTILVGAPGDEDPNGVSAGSAYVFSKADGAWIQKAKLVPNDGDQNDKFGSSVAMSADGSTALVGAAHDEDPIGTGAGSAYVFAPRGDVWKQQTKLVPTQGDGDDAFGSSVVMSADGNTVLVGAPKAENSREVHGGKVYLFVRKGGSWTNPGILSTDGGGKRDRFGSSLAISEDGTTALVGAITDNNPNGTRGGSVYVFSLRKSSWIEETKFASEDGDKDDRFGASVALSNDGNTALVGAVTDEDPNGPGAGSAYIFSRDGDFWNQEIKLAPDGGDKDDQFGKSVALSMDSSTALVGAWRDDGSDGEKSGSVYVYDL